MQTIDECWAVQAVSPRKRDKADEQSARDGLWLGSHRPFLVFPRTNTRSGGGQAVSLRTSLLSGVSLSSRSTVVRWISTGVHTPRTCSSGLCFVIRRHTEETSRIDYDDGAKSLISRFAERQSHSNILITIMTITSQP